jgi:CRP/FNR family transcriptional regulator, cyclic AMP receptor protein
MLPFGFRSYASREFNELAAGHQMAIETNAELLGRVPIFQGLSTLQLTTIAAGCEDLIFEEGTPIFKAGETGQAAYLILSGYVAPEASVDDGAVTDVLGYGTLLGELAMLVETCFTFTMTARWRVRALVLDRARLYAQMETDPSIAFHFAEKLRDRLRGLAQDLRRMDAHFCALEQSVEQSIVKGG